jgi:hypothetical protein
MIFYDALERNILMKGGTVEWIRNRKQV